MTAPRTTHNRPGGRRFVIGDYVKAVDARGEWLPCRVVAPGWSRGHKFPIYWLETEQAQKVPWPTHMVDGSPAVIAYDDPEPGPARYGHLTLRRADS